MDSSALVIAGVCEIAVKGLVAALVLFSELSGTIKWLASISSWIYMLTKDALLH